MARAGKNHKGGRPKGSKMPKTLERDKVFAEWRQKAMRAADVLLQSQLALARGSQYLFRIDKDPVYGKNGKITGYKNRKPVRVVNPTEMEEYLAGMIEQGDDSDDKDPGAAYYFLTAKDPENQAIADIMNRAYGKPKEFIELSGDKNNPVVIDTKHATQEQIDAALAKLLGK